MKGFLEKMVQNENNIKIIGGIHLATAAFLSIYGLLFKKNWFDMIYVFFIICMILSWACFNGECVLTYILKKKKNNEYICGEDSNILDDISIFIGSNELAYVGRLFICIFYAISIFIVLKRNNYSKYIYCISPSLLILYIILIGSCLDLHKNEFFLTLQEGFKFAFVIIFSYIFGKHFHLVKN